MSSDLRIGGLVSGLDTESLVTKLLEADQTKIDKEYQKRQILEWQRDDFRSVNTKLLTMKNSLFDMKLSSTYTGKTVTSSEPDYVTATGNSETISGDYNLTVKQTATRAALSSQTSLGSSGDKTNLSTQFTGLSSDTDINFSIEGQNGTMCFSTKAGNISMDNLVKVINNSNIGVQAYYDENADRFFLNSTEYGSDAGIKVKVDGAGDGKGFLKDYLKLNLSYSGNNGETGSMERTVGSSGTVEIPGTSPAEYAALSTKLSELYATTETVPDTIDFTLEGSRGSKTFSVSKDRTMQELLTIINNQTSATGIQAMYSPDDGVFILSDDMVPAATLDDGSTADNLSLTFNEELYHAGSVAISDGADLLSDFEYVLADGSSGSLSAATYTLDSKSVAFTVSNPSVGDQIRAKADTLYDSDGKVHLPQTLTWDGTQWTLDPTEPKVAIRSDADNFLAKKLKISMDEAEGQKAIIDFNGSPDIEFDSNQFELANINFNLASGTPANTSLSLTVEPDIDGAVEKIKTFVDNYNDIMEYLNTKLTEKRYRDYKDVQNNYPPLTSAQKADMTETQIEQWEAKAKSGLLRNDSILRSISMNLRMQTNGILQDQAFQKLTTGQQSYIEDEDDLIRYQTTDPDTGKTVTQTRVSYLSLESIGITTMGYASGSTDNGKLIVDETKLRDALETNPEDVSKLFTLTQTEVQTDANGNVTSTTEKNVGIAMKLYDTLTNSITEITTKAGTAGSLADSSLLTQQIAQVDERMDVLLDRMDSDEERYWSQFTAMEEALQKLSEQGSWLTQQFSQTSGTGSS